MSQSQDNESTVKVGSASQIENAIDTQHDGHIPPNTEIDQSFWKSVREAPMAVACCCYMLFTCIMWGYDGLAAAV
ncbi:hypothetical protein BJY04DRAFT_220388 [Aspergillus karnatakaensis]|uniref:uncharacterized protein n=1 Tax=Aspergillus karnatakaensis TaxID=1810916 RepID=UPI003CCCB173